VLWRPLPWLAAAAAVVLLALGGWWLLWPAAPAAGGSEGAVAWLLRSQEPDGSWSAKRWGGDERFEVALTGLALLALLEHQPAAGPPASPPDPSSRLLEGRAPSRPSSAGAFGTAVERAAEYLVRRQDEAGEFGPAFSGAPYNQGIATLALCRAYERQRGEALRAALDRAVAAMGRRQAEAGGWGYREDGAAPANLSITLWQVEALRAAGRLGWPQAAAGAERGARWMAGTADDSGGFGYRQAGDVPADAQALTAIGAAGLFEQAGAAGVSDGRRRAIAQRVETLAARAGPQTDFYSRYFLTAALERLGQTSASSQLDALRRTLLAQQVRRGPQSGSWESDARWGSTGGRVYATAMATLALK
jgi:hypothetical protein